MRRRDAMAGLATGAVCLLAFAIAHVAFITWAVDRSEDHSLAERLGRMFGAPILAGAPFMIAGSLLATYAYTRASPRLASWRFGAALATALVPAIAFVLARGPYGDIPAPIPVFVAIVAVEACAPAAIGMWAAGWRGAIALPATALIFVVPWTRFIVAQGATGWIAPFLASIVFILVASGPLMDRMRARLSA